MADEAQRAAAVDLRALARAAIRRIRDAIGDDPEMDQMTEDQAAARLRHLQAQWQELYRQHQIAVAGLDDQGEQAAANRYLTEAEDMHLDCDAKLSARIRRAREAAMPPPVGVRDDIANRIVIRTRREPKVGQFTGRHEAWAAFHDLFEVEVNGREDLEPVEKLICLKEACTGLAQKALGTWPITAANYPLAWAALQAKYNDPYATKARLINGMFRSTRQAEETYEGLRSLQDTPEIALQQLRSMGEQTQHWDVMIIHAILRRAPHKTVEAWEKTRDQALEPTLQALYDWIQKRARSRMAFETAEKEEAKIEKKNEKLRAKSDHQKRHARDRSRSPMREGTNGQRPFDKHAKRPYDGRRSESTKSAPSENTNGQQGAAQRDQRDQKKWECWLCQGGHSMYQCPKLASTDIQSRKQILLAQQICFKCGRRHLGECKTPKACGPCKTQHTQLLCPKAIQSGNSDDSRKRPGDKIQ